MPRRFPNEAYDACKSTKCFLDFLRNRRQLRNNAQKIIFDFLFAWFAAHQKIIRADKIAIALHITIPALICPNHLRASFDTAPFAKKLAARHRWGDPSKLDFYETTSVISFFFMQLKDGVGIGQDSSILTFLLFVSHCSIL